jgi:hypothetical protein
MRWLAELAEESETGMRILDANYPEELGTPVHEQLGIFLEAIHSFFPQGRASNRLRSARSMPSIAPEEKEILRAALERSSLRVLTL